jgi:hypothetical protein
MTNMKKKSPNISPAKAKPDGRRETPYFCKVSSAGAPALDTIALRAIMSGIPMQKSTRGEIPKFGKTTKKNSGED